MRLIDCFQDILGYVSLVARTSATSSVSSEMVGKDIAKLVSRAKTKARDAHIRAEDFEQAFFAVCAWIDETILCSQWAGAEEWLKNPLQRKYFKTANAGEEFFVRLQILLDDNTANEDGQLFQIITDNKQPSPNLPQHRDRSEVIEVYAACLGLGFTGKYFSSENAVELEQLKDNCISEILGHDVHQWDELSPEAYAVPVKQTAKRFSWQVFDPGALGVVITSIALTVAMFLWYQGILDRILQTWTSAP